MKLQLINQSGYIIAMRKYIFLHKLYNYYIIIDKSIIFKILH